MRICLVSPLDRRGPWTRPEYGVASWPLALGGDLFPYGADDLAPLGTYDVVLLNVDWMHYGRIAEILGRFRHKTRVLMLTCDAMFIDPQGFFPEFRTPLAALMDRADLVVSETEDLGFFRAMTATPVVHLPLPVPLAALRAAAKGATQEQASRVPSSTARSRVRRGQDTCLRPQGSRGESAELMGDGEGADEAQEREEVFRFSAKPIHLPASPAATRTRLTSPGPGTPGGSSAAACATELTGDGEGADGAPKREEVFRFSAKPIHLPASPAATRTRLTSPGPGTPGGSSAAACASVAREAGGPMVYLGSGFRAKKNGVATAMAFRRLRERVPEARGVVFAEEPGAEAEGYRLWGVEGVEVRPACDQPTLWPQVAACDLALHLDYRRTVGRFPGECAALGVPCVSTAGATVQRACFPELIVEPWDVEGAAALGARLLREPLFRDRVVAEAGRAVERFALAPMAARFKEALSRLG